ncbi:MAG: restriction endonuclease subunit S, partial [Caldisericia bacterium]|nr:restriction endonuclease subunit S [Caldisericia bacterium]
IFKEWFVKYNFPNKDGKPYKDNNGKMINSELGLIPEGWRVVSLTDIADFVNGLPMQKYRPKEGQAFLPVIKIKELNSGYSKETEKARTDLDEKYIVNPGDLVFSWSGSIGMDLWKYSKGALNQHLFKVTSTKYPKWFYYYWIKHYLPEFKQIAEGKATTMGHIQRGHLANSLLPAPKDFKNYELFEAILQKEINNNKNINNLNEQKLSNLKYLIN